MKLLGDMFGSNTHMPTTLNNPFAIDKVENIWIHMRKNLFSKGFSFTGSVEFSNGRTNGEQKFEGADIMDVVKQIYAFLEQLK